MTALIAIAKLKKPEQMSAAYHTHKDKQGAVKIAGQKRDANAPQLLFALLEESMARLGALDTSAWSEEDKNRLQTTLASLQAEIARLALTPPLP